MENSMTFLKVSAKNIHYFGNIIAEYKSKIFDLEN